MVSSRVPWFKRVEDGAQMNSYSSARRGELTHTGQPQRCARVRFLFGAHKNSTLLESTPRGLAFHSSNQARSTRGVTFHSLNQGRSTRGWGCVPLLEYQGHSTRGVALHSLNQARSTRIALVESGSVNAWSRVQRMEPRGASQREFREPPPRSELAPAQ